MIALIDDAIVEGTPKEIDELISLRKHEDADNQRDAHQQVTPAEDVSYEHQIALLKKLGFKDEGDEYVKYHVRDGAQFRKLVDDLVKAGINYQVDMEDMDDDGVSYLTVYVNKLSLSTKHEAMPEDDESYDEHQIAVLKKLDFKDEGTKYVRHAICKGEELNDITVDLDLASILFTIDKDYVSESGITYFKIKVSKYLLKKEA